MAETSQLAGDRARTPLLELVTRESLDLDYQDVARRRATSGRAPASGPHRGAAVAIGVFGLLVGVAAVQNSRNADVEQANRDALIERIEARKDAVSGLRDRVSELRTQNDDLLARVVTLTGTGQDLERTRQDLALGAGFLAVQGPGLRVTVRDQAQGDPDGLVRATDLRVLVNGLWEAGAEAVAINGRRLTALSAIVNADIAIQVNKGPLSPPYVVQAIGGPDLEADFVETQSGTTFLALAEQFGFGVERDTVPSLLLPAAPPTLQQLRYAERPSAGGPQDQEATNP